MNSDNLLWVLRRWASRQDENFVTDAFAHLLRFLFAHDLSSGIEVIRKMTAGLIELTAIDAGSLVVRTQVTGELGRPDLVLSTLDHLIWIEAKVESGLGVQQLERYSQMLRSATQVKKALVLLSRYPVTLTEELSATVLCCRWYQIAEYLEPKSLPITDLASRFVADQFIEFLRLRGMTMERVGWQLGDGVQALRNLLAMLVESISAQDVTTNAKSGWDWIGYYLDEKKFFCGVYYSQPSLLVFESNNVDVDDDAADTAGCGAVLPNPYRPGKKYWYTSLQLDSEEVHFFALSKERQRQILEQFLRDSLDAGNRIPRA